MFYLAVYLQVFSILAQQTRNVVINVQWYPTRQQLARPIQIV